MGCAPTVRKLWSATSRPWTALNDRTWLGSHVGSNTVRAYIEKRQPLICFTGHIHEEKGLMPSAARRSSIPPIWRGGYAYAEVADSQVVALEIRPV
jgi:Icc-related predicted phosphoesterase